MEDAGQEEEQLQVHSQAAQACSLYVQQYSLLFWSLLLAV
jgi:hypothetical protein